MRVELCSQGLLLVDRGARATFLVAPQHARQTLDRIGPDLVERLSQRCGPVFDASTRVEVWVDDVKIATDVIGCRDLEKMMLELALEPVAVAMPGYDPLAPRR